MSDETECPACEGEGLLWIWPCNTCGGRGYNSPRKQFTDGSYNTSRLRVALNVPVEKHHSVEQKFECVVRRLEVPHDNAEKSFLNTLTDFKQLSVHQIWWNARHFVGKFLYHSSNLRHWRQIFVFKTVTFKIPYPVSTVKFVGREIQNTPQLLSRLLHINLKLKHLSFARFSVWDSRAYIRQCATYQCYKTSKQCFPINTGIDWRTDPCTKTKPPSCKQHCQYDCEVFPVVHCALNQLHFAKANIGRTVGECNEKI